MTTYIVIAQNVHHLSGDPASYGVMDWTVEARSPAEAARIVRKRWPDNVRQAGGAFAVIPSRHFHEFGAGSEGT